MGDLVDDIRAEGRQTGVPCTTGTFVATLDPEQRAAIDQALAEGIQHASIGRWLIRLGLAVSADSATRHLRRDCACPR